jgi:prepilin-type processing-associated H-X9-DG protein
VNRSNHKGGVYAFHPGHANVAMGDGSVRALGEGIDIYAYYALCTIQAGDVVPSPEEGAKEDLPKHEPAVPVRGSILVDGKPAVGAIACFHPRNDPSPRAQRSYGRVGRNGAYSLTTFAKDDGAPQGEYVVTVYWADGGGEPHGGEETSSLRPDLLHGRFAARESSPLRATIGDKAVEFAPLDLGSSDVTQARIYQLQGK